MVVAFERTRAGGGTLSVAIFEVDALDEIERACGHDISDTVLVSVAGRIHGVFSDPGLLMCRYSRARFAVVMPGTERIEAVRLAELAQERIAGTPVKVILESNAPPSMPVTVSVGVASATPSVAARLEDFSALTAICEQSLGIARMNGPSKMRVSAPAA
jgi:diguanylate cyclase (GGDEF)-like protein